MVDQWDLADDVRRLRSRTRTVGEYFAAEQSLLKPLPTEPFETGRPVTPGVDRFGEVDVRVRVRVHVRGRGDAYSVPVWFIVRQLRVLLHANDLIVFDGRIEVTSHERLTGEAAPASIGQACRMLRLPTIRQQFKEMSHGACRDQMSYGGLLAELLTAERDDRARRRSERRSERRTRVAAFPRDKSLQAFGFGANPGIDPGPSPLATCECDDKHLSKTIARHGRVALPCIDELGGWIKAFTDLRLCAAIVDRLTFNGAIIQTGAESYRLRPHPSPSRTDQPTWGARPGQPPGGRRTSAQPALVKSRIPYGSPSGKTPARWAHPALRWRHEQSLRSACLARRSL